MAVIDLGQVGKTTKLPVKDLAGTSGHAAFTMTRTSGRYVISSDRGVHIRVDLPASTDDFRLPVGDYAKITLQKGQVINICLAENEPDGFVLFTEVTS